MKRYTKIIKMIISKEKKGTEWGDGKDEWGTSLTMPYPIEQCKCLKY